MSVQQQFLNSKELAQAISLCHLTAELQGLQELHHRTGILKNIFIGKKFEMPAESVLIHALHLLVDFIYDDNHRRYIEHLLEVGKVMEPHDPFLKRFKRFLLIMDNYMEQCQKGLILSPDVLDVQSDGILFSTKKLVKKPLST